MRKAGIEPVSALISLRQAQTIKRQEACEECLCVWEAGCHVPFEIKRAYHIGGVEAGIVRGHHAHKSLEQILLCPYGTIEVTLDDGTLKESVLLDRPDKGLYVGPAQWRTMKWIVTGSVLFVFASQHYDEADYIRDYHAFLAFARKEQ
ncbi:WxcM-like domain-containing protein [Aminithiophilus ramosus]|uniref:WxcM-like domain-containing protein n=1 Tax=Aminithiophilus ramosus TaxID=3029084 RepID=A0A9Q7A6N7_9BACT|nr:WxcM-like domain-containing protein [Aminithiophilus ramosus]